MWTCLGGKTRACIGVLVLERLLMHTNHTLGKLFVENEYAGALLKRSFSAAIMQKLK